MTTQLLTHPARAGSAAAADPAQRYEQIYREARGDRSRVAWSDGIANPALVSWLNVIAPTIIRCGSRVLVVGCGLGEDARELVRRGYDVTAFDIAPTAIEWAKRLDPASAHSYHVADLFDLPPRWRHRNELVVEINTLQSVEIERRSDAMHALREMLAPNGRLLVICRGSNEPASLDDGPPWPLTLEELTALADDAELVADRPVDSFMDGENPPRHRLRGLFRRR